MPQSDRYDRLVQLTNEIIDEQADNYRFPKRVVTNMVEVAIAAASLSDPEIRSLLRAAVEDLRVPGYHAAG